jgi:hypothetical protein
MGQPHSYDRRRESAQVIDFDEVLLNACSPDVRSDLIMEARLLAGVFAPSGDAAALERMARQLSAGERDAEMDRAHARRIAAALKRLARDF